MRKYWLSWYSLLLICAILGFLPEPKGFLKAVCVTLSVASFIPGGMLLKYAADRQDKKTVRRIRNISIISLSLTVALFSLNVVSTLMPKIWGDIFYVLLVIGSTPMVCAQIWVLSLFGWAMLMWSAIAILRKK